MGVGAIQVKSLDVELQATLEIEPRDQRLGARQSSMSSGSFVPSTHIPQAPEEWRSLKRVRNSPCACDQAWIVLILDLRSFRSALISEPRR
jgi:hypothetical protein